MATIEPAKYGGFGKAVDKPQGGLSGLAFPTVCPPVVTLDTIIIAVCGPNDYLNNASPTDDGWFFSDFYLFHHLFKGTAYKQYWLTCVSPKDLVSKYKEYAHGDPRTNQRRIVLDSSFLDDLKDVITFKGSDLAERFLAYVADAPKEVKGTSRPILIMTFGHGEQDFHSIRIGGNGAFPSCPKLNKEDLQKALLRHNPKPNVAFLTTSCYGGGWVQTPFPNMTAMAGVDQSQELLSWPVTESQGRACGSRYATGVVRALIRKELDLDVASQEGMQVLQTDTYAALVATIHEILHNEVDNREGYGLSFSAQDDLWGSDYRARTGFPLARFQQRWNLLKPIQTGSTFGISATASIKLSDTVTLSTPQAEYRLKRMVYSYLSSHPGPDEAAKNVKLHGLCRRIMKDQTLKKQDLEFLAAALRYRIITIMGRATEYKDRLGLSMVDCRDFDVWAYRAQHQKNANKQARYTQIYSLVGPHQLFDGPGDDEGLPFQKGADYLVCVLTESPWTLSEIGSALERLAKFNLQRGKYDNTVQTLRLWTDGSVRNLLGTIAKRSRKRLRSMSPVEEAPAKVC